VGGDVKPPSHPHPRPDDSKEARKTRNQETVIPRMTMMAETVRRVIGVAIVHGLDEIE